MGKAKFASLSMVFNTIIERSGVSTNNHTHRIDHKTLVSAIEFVQECNLGKPGVVRDVITLGHIFKDIPV